MSIMTHQILKEPLERWLPAMLFQVMALAAWLGVDRLYKRKKAKTYHGGTLYLPAYSSAKYQEALDAALKWAGIHHSAHAAAMIQKIQEWTDHNLSVKRPDPRPYYTYDNWCKEHFPSHNAASISRLIRSLEKWENKKKGVPGLGLITTSRDKKHNGCKRYAVDDQAVDALMDRWAAAHPEAARKFRGESRRPTRESSGVERDSFRVIGESSGVTGESHTSSNQFNKRNSANQSGIKARSTGERRGAARGLTEALTEIESHSHMQKVRNIDLGEDLALDAEHQAEERTGTSLPSSAGPLSPIDEASLDVPLPAPGNGLKRGTIETPRDAWNTAHHQLSLQFDRPSFDLWLKKAVLLKHALIDERSVYTVGVPTAHAQDMLQHRYYRNIQRVVEGLQTLPATIQFEIYAPQRGH
jgi:hypothetical protein